MVIPIKAKMSLDKVGFRTKDIARNKEYEIVQSLWKVLRQFLVQLNIHISYDLDILIFTSYKKTRLKKMPCKSRDGCTLGG